VWEDFDGNVTGDMLVAGAVHFSHAAGADLLDDAVVAQSLANSLILVHCIVRRGEIFPSPRPLRQILGRMRACVNGNGVQVTIFSITLHRGTPSTVLFTLT